MDLALGHGAGRRVEQHFQRREQFGRAVLARRPAACRLTPVPIGERISPNAWRIADLLRILCLTGPALIRFDGRQSSFPTFGRNFETSEARTSEVWVLPEAHAACCDGARPRPLRNRGQRRRRRGALAARARRVAAERARGGVGSPRALENAGAPSPCRRAPMAFPAGTRPAGPYEIVACYRREGVWARSTVPATPGSTATSRSKVLTRPRRPRRRRAPAPPGPKKRVPPAALNHPNIVTVLRRRRAVTKLPFIPSRSWRPGQVAADCCSCGGRCRSRDVLRPRSFRWAEGLCAWGTQGGHRPSRFQARQT